MGSGLNAFLWQSEPGVAFFALQIFKDDGKSAMLQYAVGPR
jgi:hypothetical protein